MAGEQRLPNGAKIGNVAENNDATKIAVFGDPDGDGLQLIGHVEKSSLVGAVDSVNSQIGEVVLDADDITETATRFWLTNILKTAYDNAVTWITTNGANVLAHLSNTSNPHNTTASQVGAPSGSGTSTGTNTGDNAINTNANSYADAKVTDAIVDGVTTVAPSQNAVFDALATKQNILTNPITGTGASGRVSFWNGTNSQSGSDNLFWDIINNRLGIGTTTPNSPFQINSSVIASALVARGANLTPTLVASANNDVLSAIDIAPTFTNGAFSNVTNFIFRQFSGGTLRSTLNNRGQQTWILNDGTSESGSIAYATPFGNPGIVFSNISSTGRSDIRHIVTGGISIALTTTGDVPINQFFFYPTGNFSINRNTDEGYRLDVNGTSRIQNKLSVGTPTQSSAILEVTSTTQGFLAPRMTTAQRTAITSPALGLLVFDNTIGTLFQFKSTGWQALAHIEDITNLTSNNYIAKTASYTTVLSDGTVNCTSGTFTVTLATTGITTGKIFRVKNSGTGIITVAVQGGALIDGVTTKIFNIQYTGGVFQFDGTNYILIGEF